ncbi:MAG: MucBP domain-containing protein, partial [Lachnospiraceae bacterium]|nr:MucBP domain-containing protein [Lachnospiraceae bacterium]
TLTVEYIFEDGTSAAAPAVSYISSGDAYSVASPAVDGYAASVAVVEGTMPESNTVITVVYTKAAATETTDNADTEASDIETLPEVIDDIPAVVETPEGAPVDEDETEDEDLIDVKTVVETPEGTPDENAADDEDEELAADLNKTPQGLPQTGTAPVAVFFGFGAAAVILGGTMIIKVRRREEEM